MGECRQCGKEYRARKGGKFCSVQCCADSKKVEKRPCQQCGKVFRPRNRANPGKYCSRNCASEARRKAWTCDDCGTEIPKTPWKKPKYCRDCRPKYAGTKRLPKVCVGCGAEFYPVGGSAGKYCSHDCYVEDRKSKLPTGNRHRRGRLDAYVRRAIKGASVDESRLEEIVGVRSPLLRWWIASQFDEGMSLANYGEWQIDHAVPLVHYDLTRSEQVAAAYNFSNLRPLWKDDNNRRGRRATPNDWQYHKESVTAAHILGIPAIRTTPIGSLLF